MLKERIARFEGRIYIRSVEALKRHARYDGVVAGFDTEYDSDTEELLTWQIAIGDRSSLVVAKKKGLISMEDIIHEVVRLTGKVPKKLLLVAYFSLADLKFFPVRTALTLDELSGNSPEVTWMVGQRKGPCHLVMTDLSRWFDGCSLAKAAEGFGLKKMEYNTGKVSRASLKDPRFIEYAKHDAVLAYQMYTRMREEFLTFGVDIAIAKTPANTAASIFRIRAVPEGVKWFCDRNEARLAACLAMWGGRAEVFRRGYLQEEHSEMDIKSCYPNACIDIGEFPIQGSWREAKTVEAALESRGGFVEVGFRFPAGTRYPCLPIYTKKNCQIYPLEGRGWVTTYEVALALEMGARIRLYEGWVYDHGVTAVADFMKMLLHERDKFPKGSVQRFTRKLMANSLTGKFGQHTDKESVRDWKRVADKYGITIDDFADMSRDEKLSLAAECGMTTRSMSLGPVWMPEWYSLITGKARAALGRAIWKTEAVYAHTDSVWTRSGAILDPRVWECKKKGPVTLCRTRLAALWDPDGAHVAYHSINDFKTAETLLRRFKGRDIKIRYGRSRPLHFKEAFRRGATPGHFIRDGEPGYWRQASSHWDRKRRLDKDGANTHPWKNLKEYYLAISEIKK